MNPYIALGALIGTLALAGASYYAGHKHAANACVADNAATEKQRAADKLQSVQRAIDQANELARQDAMILTTQEAKRGRIRAQADRIKQEIDAHVDTHPALNNVCFDADGLRLYNANPALGEPAAPAAGELDVAVPGSAESGGRAGGDNLAQQRGTGAALFGVPGALQRSHGLDQPRQ